MSRSGYEFECSRAELLGIPPPSYEEYLENVENMEIKTDEEQQMTEEPKLEHQELENEIPKTAGGGKLEEINNILQSTTEKLNRFKASYGSLTNVLKSKLGKSLDISFSQSEANGSQTNDEAQSIANTDKTQEPIIGSIVRDKGDEMASNQNGRSTHPSEDDELAYKEIKLTEDTEPDAKSPEGKKFLSFGFLNLGSGK